jgi:predicted TIM-barrel fold metal-dependent hydrolase
LKKIAVEEHIYQDLLDQAPRLEERLKDMYEAGIDMQVLSFGIDYDETLEAPEAIANAKSINNALSKVVEKYPEKFAAFGVIAPQDLEASAKEFERAITQLGLKGIMTGPNMMGEFLDEQKYWCILEMAEKLDVPIYIHPNMPPANMIKPYMVYPVLVGAMWGFAAEAGLHAMRLICSGAFDKYPRLKIILGHMGESVPYCLWRMDNQWERLQEEKLPKLEGKLPKLKKPMYKPLKKPGEYFRRNFYVTTSGVFWPLALQFVDLALGADRILFAVDSPQESAIEAAQFIESAPISDDDREKICHLNAERLLKL